MKKYLFLTLMLCSFALFATAQTKFNKAATAKLSAELGKDTIDWTAVNSAISAGADVNAPSPVYDPLTTVALLSGPVSTAKLLLEKGAKVNGSCDGCSAPLHYAARNGNVELMKLLIQYKANLEVYDGGASTPLYKAVQGDQLDAVKLLLENGADVNALGENMNTSLDVSKSTEMTTLLKSHGAKSVSELSK